MQCSLLHISVVDTTTWGHTEEGILNINTRWRKFIKTCSPVTLPRARESACADVRRREKSLSTVWNRTLTPRSSSQKHSYYTNWATMLLVWYILQVDGRELMDTYNHGPSSRSCRRQKKTKLCFLWIQFKRIAELPAYRCYVLITLYPLISSVPCCITDRTLSDALHFPLYTQ